MYAPPSPPAHYERLTWYKYHLKTIPRWDEYLAHDRLLHMTMLSNWSKVEFKCKVKHKFKTTWQMEIQNSWIFFNQFHAKFSTIFCEHKMHVWNYDFKFPEGHFYYLDNEHKISLRKYIRNILTKQVYISSKL